MNNPTPKLIKALIFDKSSALLIASNLFTIAIAIIEKWTLSQVVWIYLFQGIIIGYFNWQRILQLKKFSVGKFKMGGQTPPPTEETKTQVATFFVYHYGMFHAVCFFLLLKTLRYFSSIDFLWLAINVYLFYLNHSESQKIKVEQDKGGEPRIGMLMFFPYIRIFPMFVISLIAHNFSDSPLSESIYFLLFFLIIKLIADLIMHLVSNFSYYMDRINASSKT